MKRGSESLFERHALMRNNYFLVSKIGNTGNRGGGKFVLGANKEGVSLFWNQLGQEVIWQFRCLNYDAMLCYHFYNLMLRRKRVKKKRRRRRKRKEKMGKTSPASSFLSIARKEESY